MGESGDQQVQKTEIVENKQANKTAEATIEDVLKQKMPDDTEKQQFFLNIFQQKDIQTAFTQQEINGYIKENLNVKNFRKLKITSIEKQTKTILEDMDDQIKKVDGSLKTIQTYKSETVQNTEATAQNTEVTAQNTEVTAQNTEVTKNNVEINKLDEQYKQFSKTKESFSNLGDKQIQVTDENKKNIPQNVITTAEEKIKAIKESNPKADIQINDYLSFYLTAQQESIKDTDFAKDFDKLNTMWGIEKTTMKDNMDADNTENIVKQNKGINNFTNTSKDLSDITKPTVPEFDDIKDPGKKFEKEYDMYVKFITDKDTKNNIEKNKDTIKDFVEVLGKDEEEARDTKGAAAYEEYTKAITDIKENLPTTTQTIIKQRVMGSCISGLAQYFDTKTVNQDNFADDFDIDTQDGFSMQKGDKQYEKESDDVLYIKGDINGSNVGFYYNLTNPDAQLKSDDFLHFDAKTDAFSFGVDGGGKNELGVKLPTIEMLSAQAQSVSEKNFSTLLEKSTSLEEFETAMKKEVSTELLKNYGQEALVKTRVERDVEKNMTAQKLNSTFVPEAVLAQLNSDKSIDKITEKRPRKLLNIRDKTTENMRSDELRRLRSLTERLDPIITRNADKPQENLEPKRQKLLEGMDDERGAVAYSEKRGKNTLKFFQRFSENDQINMENMDAFITSLEKKENIADNMSKFSPEFQTTEDHEEADGLIQQIV